MPKYRANRSFIIPDGRDSEGRQKIIEIIEGHVYEFTENQAKNLGYSTTGTTLVLVVENPKSTKPKVGRSQKKGEKKPDIRTR